MVHPIKKLAYKNHGIVNGLKHQLKQPVLNTLAHLNLKKQEFVNLF